MASTFGLRILVTWGIGRIVRMVALLVWLAVLANSIAIQRPDLLFPAAFGSDTSNYAAFGERLADARELYALSPGDRPVPANNPPHWSVPILSPPQMAVPWAVLAALPDVVRFYGPWSVGIAGTLALGFLFIARAPSPGIVAGSVLFAGLAVTAWSGNVNAIIAPAGLLIWWAGTQATRRRWLVIAGAGVALLAATKIGPAMLWLWLVRRRGWDPAVGGGVTVLMVTVMVLAIAGLPPFEDYLMTSLASAGDPSRDSIPGFLFGLGVSPGLARVMWLGILLVLAAVVALAKSPSVSFVAAIAGMVFLTPVVRQETMSLLLGAASPWILRGDFRAMRGTAAMATATGIAIAIVSVVASLLGGGLDRSSMAIENASDQPITVRFGAPMQQASWGYALDPGQSGWAWSSVTGTLLEPIRIFNRDCRLIETLRPTGIAAIRIDREGAEIGVPINADRPLGYDESCALAMPPPGAPVE